MREALILVVVAACGRFAFDDSHPTSFDSAAEVTDAPRPGSVLTLSGSMTVYMHLLALDLATGELVDHGALPPGLPLLGGLAYGDPNTLYASGTDTLVELTLAPAMARTFPLPTGTQVSGLERSGPDELVGIDQSNDTLVRMSLTGTSTAMPLTDPGGSPVLASGGDIVQLSTGTWLWWSNTTQQLYQIDLATAISTPIGPAHPTAPTIVGMARDASDRVFMTSNGNDTLLEIDPTTGQLGATKPLCMPCPTPYDLLSGDLAWIP